MKKRRDVQQCQNIQEVQGEKRVSKKYWSQHLGRYLIVLIAHSQKTCRETIKTQCAQKTFLEMKWEYNSVQISYWRTPTPEISKINNANEWEYYAPMSNRFKNTGQDIKVKLILLLGLSMNT